MQQADGPEAETLRRQRALSEMHQQAQYLSDLCERLFEGLRKCKFVGFQATEAPFKSFVRTHCAGSVVPAKMALPRARTLKELAEKLREAPLRMEEESFKYRETREELVLLENARNRWCTRALVFQTASYFVVVVFFRSTTPLDPVAEGKEAKKIVKLSSLDQIQLMDRPAPVRPRVLESLEDEGLLFKKRKLEWAARQTRQPENSETVIAEVSARLSDFAWKA